MKRGRQTRDTLFKVYAHSNALSYGRLGITVSKQVSRRAVDRNRVKRQIRESYRLCHEQLAGLDVVVMATGTAGQAGNPALRQSLKQHWEQIALRCKPS
jgi:ribonuclease P protein component